MNATPTGARAQHEGIGLLDDVTSLPAPSLVLVGDQMGFYRALDMLGSLTPDELAEVTATDERYVQGWLQRQAATGHLRYSARTRRFSLTPGSAMTYRSTAPY